MAWTAPRTWVATNVLTAAQLNTDVRDNLNAIGPFTVVYKTSDETVNNSVTLQNDDDLVFAVGANENWVFRFCLAVTTSSVADFKCGLTLPTSPTSALLGVTMSTPTTPSVTAAWAQGSSPGMSVLHASTAMFVVLQGMIDNGANAGNVQLQWAQNTNEVSNTIVETGSFVEAHRII